MIEIVMIRCFIVVYNNNFLSKVSKVTHVKYIFRNMPNYTLCVVQAKIRKYLFPIVKCFLNL